MKTPARATTTVKSLRRHRHPVRAWAVVAVLLLAGCAGKPAVADDEYDAFDELALEAGDGGGVIRGVVVDESVLPIQGVTVRLQGEGRVVTTNADGAFGFGNVSAGVHFLQVSKLGYFSVTPRVHVEAGVERPNVTKVVLVRDEATAPFVAGHVWTGFVQCSLSGFPLCRFIAPAGVNDQTLTVYDVAPGTTWVQSEMHWVSSQPVSDELWLFHGYGDGSEAQFGFAADQFGNVQGESPLVLVTNEQTVAEAGRSEDFARLGVEHELVPFVLGGSIPESRVLCAPDGPCGGIGITWEQEFTVYTHLFYRFTPPEDWVFSRDGVPSP